MGRSLCVACGLLLALGACDSKNGGAIAKRVESPNELIGGPKAIGTTGDWLLQNDQIRLVLQNEGWSRGFGIFGGGIIDADLQRPGEKGSSTGGNGKDNFGELFPALFLQAFDVSPQKDVDFDSTCHNDNDCGGNKCERNLGKCSREVPGIEVIKDGSDGGEAVIRTYAGGGDFIFMVSQLLHLALPPAGNLLFYTDYSLKPGERHVTITGHIKNITGLAQNLDAHDLLGVLSSFGVQQLQLPIGEVVLFGDGNTMFAPGAVKRPDRQTSRPIGFDTRFAMEDSYKVPKVLPALPGLVTDFIATASGDVSYGYAAADSDNNYVWMNRDQYAADPQAKVSKHSLLVPFLIDAFTGAYQEVPPPVLDPGVDFSYTRYFIIGQGDVASVRDELYKIRGIGTGVLRGVVRNQLTGQPESEAWVQIFDADRHPYSQVRTLPDGTFECRLEPGDYFWVVTAPGRYPYPSEPHGDGSAIDPHFDNTTRFTITDSKTTVYRDLRIPAPAELVVDVRDGSGRILPAKVNIVGHYQAPAACTACVGPCDDVCSPNHYAFNFSLGEERRYTDFGWRDNLSRSGDYIEQRMYSQDGPARGFVRPGTFDVYVSRGMEYDLFVQKGVTFTPGQQTTLSAVLHRTVDTTDWVSGDFHVHSGGSVDSGLPFDLRVRAAAAEGLEIATATEHNFTVDYDPYIKAQGLQDWMNGIVGVELSTLEMGHFNAFPIRYTPGTATHLPYVDTCYTPEEARVSRTAFDWVQCAPGQIFSNLRRLGKYPGNTIVQVNHPRDTILGYFNQMYVNPYTAQAEEPTNLNYSFVEFPLYLRPQNQETGQFDPSKFSYDFDAIEVFNGKRLDMLHPFIVPDSAGTDVTNDQRDVCKSGGNPENGPGKILLRKGGYPSYPGAVDDWFNLLNTGYTMTATGNSDSHNLGSEVGTPRTFVFIPPEADGTHRDAHVGSVSDLDVVDALRGHHAIATNGPFLQMYVNTRCVDASGSESVCSWKIGDTVDYGASNAGLSVEIQLVLRTAPWINVDRIVLYGNGKVIETIGVEQGKRADGRDIDDETSYSITKSFDVDTILVAEAYGSTNLFPVVAAKEEPPTNIADALGGITSSLGFSLGTYDGVHGPSNVQKQTPYAITNPIWLNIDASHDSAGAPSFNPIGPATPRTPAPATPGPCDAQDRCIGSQVCDTSAALHQCVCPDTSAVRDPNATAAFVGPLLLAPGGAGQHYSLGDIRSIFHGQTH